MLPIHVDLLEYALEGIWLPCGPHRKAIGFFSLAAGH